MVGALASGRSKVWVASRLALAVGAKLPAMRASPVGSMAMLVRLTGAAALPGLDAAMPPKRAVWSMRLAAFTRRTKLLPMLESGVRGRSGSVSVPLGEISIQAVPDAPAATKDCAPSASSVEARTVLPSSDMRSSV